MKKMIILLGCVWGMILSCTHDEPNNSGTETGQRVVEWQDSTLSGDAVMGMKMLFRVSDSIQVIRKPSTRLSTDFGGQTYTLSGNERITIAMQRGSDTEVIKIYKVKNAATGALEYEKDADDGNTGPFYWKSTTETVKLRAWSNGTSEPYSNDPLTTSFTLNTTQTETSTGIDNYKELLYAPQWNCNYQDNNGGVTLNLYHQMARLTVTLEHSRTTDDLNVTANSVVIGDGTLPITAKFSSSGIDIENNDYVGTWTGYTYDTENNTGKVIARTDVANQKYSAVLFPGEIAAGKKLITLATADGTFAYKLPTAFTLDPGCQYNYTVNVKDLIPVSELTISDITGTFTYNGSPHEPKPATVKYGNKILVENTDYTLSWSNNTNAGTATCTITGKGNVFTGYVNKTFTIKKAIATLSFAESSKSTTYVWDIQTLTNALTVNPSGAEVTYSSSNTSVATVDASTGALLPGGSTGSATITASTTETGNYTAASVTYTVSASANRANFSYTGKGQSITLPKGVYKFECWGARSGSVRATAGKGGYAAGNLRLTASETFYACVGQQGTSIENTTTQTYPQTWNGGGGASMGDNGGGATDFRLTMSSVTDWSNTTSLRSRIIVAGGAGGGDIYSSGIHGGGLEGGSGSVGKGGTQEAGGAGYPSGAFGIGGHDLSVDGGGGGGGWYGGGHDKDTNGTGGGGSGFVSGHTGCKAIDSNGNKISSSVHFSGYEFLSGTTSLIGGNLSMPAPGGGTETGHNDAGYARITWVSN